jgi:predicted nucleotidyltransferase
MFDPAAGDPSLLHLADQVVAELLNAGPHLAAGDLMLVGAHCRDVIQSALGRPDVLRATSDIDVAIAVKGWRNYAELTESLPATGTNGICYQVAGMPTDLLPFGDVEEPTGTVTPPRRGDESLSVWGFREVHEAALPLRLPTAGECRIPTVPGYVALKLAAWLDRSEYGEYKDAIDLGSALPWYAEASSVTDLIYETEHGNELLVASDTDPVLASARLLGEHVIDVVGPERQLELLERWPGTAPNALVDQMGSAAGLGWSLDRRREVVAALEAGLVVADRPPPHG